ncbi:hypothetical protein OUZ56_005680 [Daphnia magna]|uniref:Secreted protein n=1 Tax=Daphnia magna TaxID=35525 RepID=A0ABQ9YTJ8_9CRUS|nr:hypothetical protein OUZ56_005680 [Daphnia magna]
MGCNDLSCYVLYGCLAWLTSSLWNGNDVRRESAKEALGGRWVAVPRFIRWCYSRWSRQKTIPMHRINNSINLILFVENGWLAVDSCVRTPL